MSFALLLALMAPAQAESEVFFRTAGPVTIFVDGRQASLTSNLKMRAKNLAPGDHQVRVQGVFGKTLYEGEIEVADWTITHMEWAGGDLAVYRTEALDTPEVQGGQWSDPDGGALPVPEEPPPGEDEIAPEPSEPEHIAEVHDDAGAALAIPVSEEGHEHADDEQAAPVDESVAQIPAGPPSSTLMVEAYEGVQVELAYGEARLYLTVTDGVFVVRDQNGVQVSFAENP